MVRWFRPGHFGAVQADIAASSVCFGTHIEVAKAQPVPQISGRDASENFAALIRYRTSTLAPQITGHLAGQLEVAVPSQHKALQLKSDIT